MNRDASHPALLWQARQVSQRRPQMACTRPTKFLLFLGLCAVALGPRPALADAFTGEISDSQCATNVRSAGRAHKELLKTGTMGANDSDCARNCVHRLGGVFVLVMKEKIYRLDDQELAEKNAGTRVKVTGTLDEATHTLHVLSIQPNP
jgi:hypothetical protein